MNYFEYVIIGGGLAGLCAAKRLLELGISPLVIEAGAYPAHKVCGEFISPSSLSILNRWGIHPIPINHLQLHIGSKQLDLTFSEPVGSLSHLTLDFQLANQISEQGASLLTQTKVVDLSPASREEDYHSLTLSSGEEIKAKHLLIATGRLPGHSIQSFQPRYIGLKAHFSGLDLDSTLSMFSFKGAYLGISPVENQYANLACLVRIEQFQQFSSANEFMNNLITSHPQLKHLLSSKSHLFVDWLQAAVPEFGLRRTFDWPHTYWIGDAAGTIPPASGNGLSLAIASGYLAAEFAVKDRPRDFKHMWKKRCSLQILFAKGLHHLFLNPTWGSKAVCLNNYFPFLAQSVFKFTRYSGSIH